MQIDIRAQYNVIVTLQDTFKIKYNAAFLATASAILQFEYIEEKIVSRIGETRKSIQLSLSLQQFHPPSWMAFSSVNSKTHSHAIYAIQLNCTHRAIARARARVDVIQIQHGKYASHIHRIYYASSIEYSECMMLTMFLLCLIMLAIAAEHAYCDDDDSMVRFTMRIFGTNNRLNG